MSDITKQPYAEWLENALRELVQYAPDKIAIVASNKDSTATIYYNCDSSDMASMAANIQQDGLFARIEANKDWLRGLLDETEDDA